LTYSVSRLAHQSPHPGIGLDQSAKTIHQKALFPGMIRIESSHLSQQSHEQPNVGFS